MFRCNRRFSQNMHCKHMGLREKVPLQAGCLVTEPFYDWKHFVTEGY